MLDPSAPGSVVFVAPDGGVYVDRDGTSPATIVRWRQGYDPVAVRRRRRWRDLWEPLVSTAACAAAGAGLGVLTARWGASWAWWRPGTDVLVAGALLGLVVGFVIAVVVQLLPPRRPEPSDQVVPVPSEVLRAAPASASATEVWQWSTALRHEAQHRTTIGWETYVERPPRAREAERAADRYRAEYAAYLETAAALGLVVRPPAVDLDDPFTS